MNGSKTASVPLHLTDDRSAQGLANMLQADFGTTITPSQINSAALALFQAKVGGQYLIPTPQITNVATAAQLGYDVYLQAPASFTAQQAVVDLDYLINSKDRLAQKYTLSDRSFERAVRRRFHARLPQGGQARVRRPVRWITR